MKVLNISILLLFFCVLSIADGGSIGVNYGRLANNLPEPKKVVQLLKSKGLNRVKIFDADQTVLKAFAGSGIKLTVCVPNQLIQNAARNTSFATKWVTENVAAYKDTDIEAIAVGNEVSMQDTSMSKDLVPAMENIYKALQSNKLDHVKVSTPLAYEVFLLTYPPSSGVFDDRYNKDVFLPMLEFLRRTKSSLMVNIYPFITYKLNKEVIKLDYALGQNTVTITDKNNQKKYTSLFDAQVDAAYSAKKKLNFDDVPMIVTEIGWASKGDPNEDASIENASTFTRNLVQKIVSGRGTPLQPNLNLTVYLFALFNENQKPGPSSEKNFGLFYPNMTEVYHVSFTTKGGERDAQAPAPGMNNNNPHRKAAPGTNNNNPHSTDDNAQAAPGTDNDNPHGGSDNEQVAPALSKKNPHAAPGTNNNNPHGADDDNEQVAPAARKKKTHAPNNNQQVPPVVNKDNAHVPPVENENENINPHVPPVMAFNSPHGGNNHPRAPPRVEIKNHHPRAAGQPKKAAH